MTLMLKSDYLPAAAPSLSGSTSRVDGQPAAGRRPGVSDRQGLVKKGLYEQVYEIIAQRIAAQIWPGGTYLPNEYELSTEFGVSIGTVRRAVSMLVEKGMVNRQQGRGTIVTHAGSRETARKINRCRFGEEQDYLRWNLRMLSSRTVSAEEPVATLLKVSPGEQLYVIERIRSVGENRSAAYDEVYLPKSLYPKMPDSTEDLEGAVQLSAPNSLYIERTEERVTAIAADDRTAQVLGINPGTPLLKMVRVSINQDGTPMELRISRCNLDGGYYWLGPD